MDNIIDSIRKSTKRPIVILSNYRTGSTALADEIHRFFFVHNFSEPHLDTEIFNKLKNSLESKHSNFVLKIMFNQINDFYQEILNLDCFKIKLTRKDLVKQILSYYIAFYTNKWQSEITDPIMEYSVDIDKNYIHNAINNILICEQASKNLDIKYDMELYYEDIKFNNIALLKTIPPKNFREIELEIIKIIQLPQYEKYFTAGSL
jgi:hypothetical protein